MICFFSLFSVHAFRVMRIKSINLVFQKSKTLLVCVCGVRDVIFRNMMSCSIVIRMSEIGFSYIVVFNFPLPYPVDTF